MDRGIKFGDFSALMTFLQGAAFTVIILWGVRAASELLGTLLLSLMLAYAVAPFAKWLMHRFKLKKSRAAGITAIALAATGALVIFGVEFGIARLAIRLPIYAQRLNIIYEQATTFLNAHGIATSDFSIKDVLTIERLSEVSFLILPAAGTILAKGFLILLLAFLSIIEMLPAEGYKLSPLGELLSRHGFHSRRYVNVTVKIAGINALVNLAFLLAMGVDAAFLWAFVYFLLDFIPTLGFSIALIPPTFITLLMYGWQRALLVACGLILTNLIVDNLVMPIFAKHAMNISFLEITVSLVGWGYLLGLPGAVIAIPMTLGFKEFFVMNRAKAQLD